MTDLEKLALLDDIDELELLYPQMSIDVLMNPHHLDHPYNQALECPTCGRHRKWELGRAMYADGLPGYLGSYGRCKVCGVMYKLAEVRKPYMRQMLLF